MNNDIQAQNIRPFTVHPCFVQAIENDNLSGPPKDKVSIAVRINNNVLCLTSSCIVTASRSLEYFNTEIDPCVDFYSFACGAFLEESILPDEGSEKTLLTDVSELVNKQLHEVIKESKTNKLESRVSLIKLLNRCLHVDGNTNHEVENVKSLLNSLGDWPILVGTKWDESKFNEIELTLRQ
ncbi:hypothetical protein FQR65_LT04620 [Abscondita terminalis]|nr:hypothetical protein FQR65_LT04620 [Abscondita terminalis]